MRSGAERANESKGLETMGWNVFFSFLLTISIDYKT